MLRLEQLVQSIPASNRKAWYVDGERINVAVRGGSRHQTITIERVENLYRLESVVLGTASVTKNVKRWRKLALLVWEKNAQHQIVTFGFDRRDRLVGHIEHQADYLDPEELELYVNTLARECDRFEYLLTGKDLF
ncbi:MAG TPA: hypothetical protein VEK15_04385 [Vicinamibacteria bacterium]|nr:hypothetical protein [Vicinamibacteria bacterium]